MCKCTSIWGNGIDIPSASKRNLTVSHIHEQGYFKLYIDGGRTVQRFLKDDLIDELIISTIPILLGGGFSLFGDLSQSMEFEHVKTEVLLDQMVQSHYRRK